jgi:hypothetical protein
VRDYSLMCLVALMLVTVVLLNDGLTWWSVMPLLLGLVSLLTSWSVGPPLLLLLLTTLLVFRNQLVGRWGGYRPADSPLTDLALAASLLACVAAQYRLMTLVRRAHPFDRRRPRLASAGGARSPDLVTGRELGALLLGAGTFSLAALIGWQWLRNTIWYPIVPMARELWFAVVIILLFGLALGVAAAVLGYLRWTSATGAESLLSVQDQAWAATRGEQRRLQRWLVWARLRAQRRKEGP